MRKSNLRLVGKSSKSKPNKPKQPVRFIKEDELYRKRLNRLLDEIYEIATEAMDWTWARLAREAHLSDNTVYRLGNRITRFPVYRTVWKLAHAIGMEVHIRTSAVQAVKKHSKRKVG